MRTFSVVGRPGSSTMPSALMAAAASCSRSRWPAASTPTTPTSSARPPSAAMLWATFAAPPIRTYSDWNRTTGTGASGEIRVTDPTTKRSSITSPTTRTGTPRNRAIRSDARRGSSGGSMPIGGGGQRHEDQEEHQHFGVAKVVFEEARGQQRGDDPQGAGGQKAFGARRADE